ncbi:MAG: hypothetical protein QOI38_3009 [Sphingomonadales bacterium]|jgi:uncharacterized membrane protein YhaH (DUF805 family)|nr:hypothetical protein [Sphingomonadales bacterium]
MGAALSYMILPLKRYLDFSGRSRRKEYWMYFLFVIIGLFVFMYLDTVLGLGGTTDTYAEYGDAGASAGIKMTGGILTLLFVLATIIPGIAVFVRRAHDQDKSGWFVLIPVYNLIMMFIEGTRGPNRFGPDPKAGDADGRTAAV